MTSSPLPISASFTEPVPIKLGSGSRGSGSELSLDSRAEMPSSKGTSPSDQALRPTRTTTFGKRGRRPASSMACAIHAPISIRSNGSIGQELLDADGQVIAWTTDLLVAQVIAEMMNDVEMEEQASCRTT
jgi:hypothetical protein